MKWFEMLPFIAAVLVLIAIAIVRQVQRGILRVGKIEEGFEFRYGSVHVKRTAQVSIGGTRKFFSFKLFAVRIIRTGQRSENGRFGVSTLKAGWFMLVRLKKHTMQERYKRITCSLVRSWQPSPMVFILSFKRPTSRMRQAAKERQWHAKGVDISERQLRKQRWLLALAGMVLMMILCISAAVFLLGLGVTPKYDGHGWWLGLKVFTAIGPALMAGPFVLASTFVLGRRIRGVRVWYDVAARQAVRLTMIGLLVSYLVTLTTANAGKGVALAQQCILVLGFLVIRSFIGRGDEQAALAKRMAKVKKRLGEDHQPLRPRVRDYIWSFVGLVLFLLALAGAIWSWIMPIQIPTPIGVFDDLLIFRTCVGTLMAGVMTIAARLGGQVSRQGLGYLGWWSIIDRRPWAALLKRRGWKAMGPLWGLLTSLGQILTLGVFGTSLSVYLAQVAARVYAHHWEAYHQVTAFPIAQSGALLAALEFVGGIFGLISMVLMSSGKDGAASSENPKPSEKGGEASSADPTPSKAD